MNNRPTSISLGPYDPFKRVPTLTFQDGKITFLPGRGATELATVETQFPPGARLEYRIEKGDMYLKGDHSLGLNRALWVIHPDGTRKLLARDFTLYIHLRKAARNLERVEIPFTVVSFYQAPDGHEVETEIEIMDSPLRFPLALLLGFLNLLLGALAALFLNDLRYVISVGAVGLLVLAILTLRSGASRKTGILKVLSILPSFAGGYALSVVLVRHFLGRP